VQPVILHGPEFVLRPDQLSRAGRQSQPVQHVTHIHAPLYVEGMGDSATAGEFHRKHLLRLHVQALRLNTDGVADKTRRHALER
jgi:hypothetical protein